MSSTFWQSAAAPLFRLLFLWIIFVVIALAITVIISGISIGVDNEIGMNAKLHVCVDLPGATVDRRKQAHVPSVSSLFPPFDGVYSTGCIILRLQGG